MIVLPRLTEYVSADVRNKCVWHEARATFPAQVCSHVICVTGGVGRGVSLRQDCSLGLPHVFVFVFQEECCAMTTGTASRIMPGVRIPLGRRMVLGVVS